MTIQTYEGGADVDVRPSDPTGGRLVAWAAGLSAAHQIGTALCGTSFVPKDFRGKPEEAAAAILYGDEIGLSPTQSLQGVYVISGRPALYARTMAAVVMAAGHEVWTVSKTDAEVVVAGRRRGSNHTIEEKWTTARAKRAGYLSNKKYDTDPAAMLYARALSDVCRQIAPDALAGLAFSVEELQLAEPVETVTVTREPAKRRTAQRAQRPAAIEPPEPSLDPAPEPEPEPAVDDAVTPAQIKMLAATMKDANLTDRADALAYVASVIGREVASRNDLTRAEASRVIDALLHADDDIADAEVVTEGGES
jgi:hypothetical protein